MSTTGRDIRGSRWHRTRRLRLVALGALFALAAPACSGGSGGEGPGPDASGKGPGTTAAGPIVVASGLDVTGSGGVRQQLIEEWNRQHQDDPALRAKLVELPGGADQQRSQLLGALQSGSAAYDVVNLDITWIPEFAEAGLIQALPADEADDPDFIPRVQSTTLWEGRSYARPFNSDVGLLYYRRDLLQNGGITEDRMPNSSWTWESLYASITTLDNGTLDRERGEAGWTTQLRQYEGLTVNTIEAFAAVGVELVRDDGTYRSDPAELKKGLNELLRHADNDRLLPAALSSDENATLADFAAGRVAYLRHWPYAYGALQSLLKPGQYAVTGPARPRRARRPEPRRHRGLPASGERPRADQVPDLAGERTLPARRGVRRHPHLGLRAHRDVPALLAGGRRSPAPGREHPRRARDGRGQGADSHGVRPRRLHPHAERGAEDRGAAATHPVLRGVHAGAPVEGARSADRGFPRHRRGRGTRQGPRSRLRGPVADAPAGRRGPAGRGLRQGSGASRDPAGHGVTGARGHAAPWHSR
ncbi:extracellular solute-binding protein [Streptomyces sp. TE33382]